MKHLVAIAPTIPGEAWSGVATLVSGFITAAIALAVVWLSNRNARKVVAMQLASDAEQRTKDRLINARRDTYLQLADATHQAILHISSIPTMDPTQDNLAAGLTPLNSSAMKAQLLCEFDTAVKIDALVMQCTKSFFNALRLSEPLHDTNRELASCNQGCAEQEAEVRRIIAALSTLNESASADEPRFQAHFRSYKVAREQLDELYQKRAEIHERRVKLHRDIAISMREDTINVARDRIRAFSAFRSELEGTPEEEAFERRLMSNVEQLERRLAWLQEPRDEERD